MRALSAFIWPLDEALRARHERRADDVALDPAIDMQVDACLDIAANGHITAQDRERGVP